MESRDSLRLAHAMIGYAKTWIVACSLAAERAEMSSAAASAPLLFIPLYLV
jgi:hypothetical protein